MEGADGQDSAVQQQPASQAALQGLAGGRAQHHWDEHYGDGGGRHRVHSAGQVPLGRQAQSGKS